VTAPTETATEPHVDPRRWLILPVLCLSLLLVVVTNGTVYVALPSMARDLHASASQLQWIVDAYTLVFAGLLLPAGSIGDRFGRKGTLQIGLAWFTTASLFGTIADSAAQVIAVRAAMGLGAALVMPSTLSILANVFPPRERPKAIAIWAGVAGVGGVAGPLVTGGLLTTFWWGSVFLVNVPIVAVALVAGAILVPTSRDPHPRRLDPVGAGLSAGSLALLLYGVIEGPGRGWGDPVTIVVLALAAVGFGTFAAWELHTHEPMLELRLFGNRRMSIGAASIGIGYFTVFGLSFLTVQFLQEVRGLSPLAGAVRTIPVGVALILVAPRSAGLAARFGTGRVVAAGMTFIALGMTVFAFTRPHTRDLVVLVGFGLIGVGMALATAPSTNAIMGAVPRHNAGMGSAVNDTTREVGGAVGIAVLGTLLATGYRSAIGGDLRGLRAAGLTADQASRARGSIAGAITTAHEIGGETGARLLRSANAAFCHGIRIGAWAVVVMALVGAVLAWRTMPHADREPHGVHVGPSPAERPSSSSSGR
jgi:EmrB/QacA subfamily drug resistance transporter